MTEPISRALNINAAASTITAMCAKHDIEISAIEPLLSGGTRVVLMNVDDAAAIQHAFRTKLVKGPVTRTRWVRNQ